MTTTPPIPTNRPTAWTTLHIPLIHDLSSETSLAGKTWLSIIKSLTQASQPGFLHGIWGRTIEDPEVVYLVTGWETFDAIKSFEESETYKQQLKAIGELSVDGEEPRVVHAPFIGDFWPQLTSRTGITDIYFPSSISPDAQKRASSLRGLVYFFRPGKGMRSAYNSRGLHGWIDEAVMFKGKETKVLRFIHYWNSEEGEQEFKKEAGLFSEGEKYEGIYEGWLSGLRTEGMIGMNEVHVGFQSIPSMFFEYTEEDLREMEEMDAAEAAESGN